MSYQKDPRPFFNIPLPQRYPGMPHFLFIKIILVAVIFGFLSGWVGSLVLETYFFPKTTTNSFFPPIFSRESVEKEQSSASISLLVAERKQIDWYYRSQKKALPGEEKEFWYIPNASQGKGVVLTSDGWVFVVGDIGKERVPQEILISFFDGKIFEAEKILYDPFFDISFIKIPAQNLSVAQFAPFEKEDENIYRILSNHFLKEYRTNGMIRKDDSVAFLSSDRLQYFLSATDEIDSSDIGSSFFNNDGEIVGILYGEKAGNILILPTFFLENAISQILQEEKITHRSFNFSYLPLEEIFISPLSGVRNDQNLSQGFLLVNSPEKPLFKSIFGKNIAEGDILVSIENIVPSSKFPVEYLLRSFNKKTGDELKVKIFSKQSKEMQEIRVRFP